jgi:hypothetical protein
VNDRARFFTKTHDRLGIGRSEALQFVKNVRPYPRRSSRQPLTGRA